MRNSILIVLTTILSFTVLSSNASTIRGASSVINSVPKIANNLSIENTFDQSGLSSSYVNGVTDFESYVATTTHSISVTSEWGAYASPVVIDYDLGDSYSVNKLAIWNAEGETGIKSVNIFASADSSFSTSINLGTFSLLGNPSSIDYLADVFGFSPVTAQFIRLEVSNSSFAVALGEVAFSTSEISEVPIPAAAFMFAPALLGFMGLRRRAKVSAV